MIYCDYNATTPMSDDVLDVVLDTMKNTWGNSFSPHSLGRKASVLVEEARLQVAHMVGVSPRNIRFTSGATEANSWVLHAFSKKGPICTSSVEHPSVLQYSDSQIPTDNYGAIKLEALEQILIQNKPSYHSVMAANNETGVRQDVMAIANRVRSLGGLTHCDAAQSFGKVSISFDTSPIPIRLQLLTR